MASSPLDEKRALLLRTETQTLLQSSDFVRSPVMSRLLRYLVEEAIAHPDTPPKAYQVAVDGLGRRADFDVQADSYPRVQVGRLRKMLSAYYAARGIEQKLGIPIGHYAVEIQLEETGAEKRPLGNRTSDSKDSTPPSMESSPDRWFSARQTAIGLAGFLLLAVIGLLWFLSTNDQEATGSETSMDYHSLPPIIHIAASGSTRSGEDENSVNNIRHFFENAFAKSSQVRLAGSDETNNKTENGENAYRFESQIIAGAIHREVKFSLTSLLRNETIWSATVALPNSVADYPEQLGPIASRVASIYGAIATDQRRYLPTDAMTGYSCLLRFESYRANRDPDLLPVVESCIKRSLEVDPLDSRVLAAASFISFLREEASGRKPDPEAGLEFARRAMVRGREDASANFALARSSFFNGSCARGKEFAEKAVELDPYEATIQAQTGAYLFACDDANGTKYLRRAIALDPRGSLVAETALVLTLLAEGKDKEALEFAEKIVPSSTGVGPYYDIAMAMVYAKNGRIKESRRSWDRLVAAYGNKKDESPKELLGRLITNPSLANRALRLLLYTGVISQ